MQGPEELSPDIICSSFSQYQEDPTNVQRTKFIATIEAAAATNINQVTKLVLPVQKSDT